MRDRPAGAHQIAVWLRCRTGRLAVGETAGTFQHQASEAHDAEIGRTEMLARAIGDEALAVLNAGVLLGDALDAGKAAILLLDPIDQVIVVAIADRHPVLVHAGVDRVPGVESLPL